MTGVNSTLTLPINHEWLAKENGIIIITGSFSSDYQNRNRTPIYIGINFNFKENKMANIISDEGVIDFLKSMKECN